jgi:acyl dehydratase
MKVGEKLPEWELPITPTFVVSSALATRDFQNVHHDRDAAQAAGSKDIFPNILTSTALCERYVTEWAGPAVQIKGVSLRLGAPVYPYETLAFAGEVTEITDRVATITVTATAAAGNHIIGTVQVVA